MKITAINQASFSLPVVLCELIIINIGNSQINPIKAIIISAPGSDPSIYYKIQFYLLHITITLRGANKAEYSLRPNVCLVMCFNVFHYLNS